MDLIKIYFTFLESIFINLTLCSVLDYIEAEKSLIFVISHLELVCLLQFCEFLHLFIVRIGQNSSMLTIFTKIPLKFLLASTHKKFI